MNTVQVMTDLDEIFSEDEPQLTPEQIYEEFKNETSSKRWAWRAKNHYGLNYKEEYDKHRQYRKGLEMAECGSYRYRFSPRTGEAVPFEYSCKHFDECSKCSNRRRNTLREELDVYGLHDKHYVIFETEEEAKQALRSLSKDEYKRYPLKDGRVLTVACQGVLDGAGAFTPGVAYDLSAELELSGKRVSGSLPVEPKEPEPEKSNVLSFEELEEELFNPEFTVDCRNYAIEFERDNPALPQSIIELEKLVREEAKINYYPQSQKDLQRAIITLEDTTQAICKRLGLSFNFYSRKQDKVRLNDIQWKWLLEKLNPAE